MSKGRYKILYTNGIKSGDIECLSDDVNCAINHGWEVLGPPQICAGYYDGRIIQAMVRRDSKHFGGENAANRK